MTSFQLTDLLEVFGELLPATDEERKVYWLRTERPDGVSVTLVLSAYEESAHVIVRVSEKLACSSIHVKNCSEVNVLSGSARCIEVLAGDPSKPTVRCLISFRADTVLEIDTFGSQSG